MRSTLPTRPPKLLFLLFIALLAGCDGPTEPVQSIEGDWVLTSMNDSALPYMITWSPENQVWVTAGTRVFRADGSCTNQSTTESHEPDPLGGTSVRVDTTDSVCTWRRVSANRFDVVSPGGFTFQAMRDGTDLVVTAPSGTEYRYQ